MPLRGDKAKDDGDNRWQQGDGDGLDHLQFLETRQISNVARPEIGKPT
jgi:hypothetical protein